MCLALPLGAGKQSPASSCLVLSRARGQRGADWWGIGCPRTGVVQRPSPRSQWRRQLWVGGSSAGRQSAGFWLGKSVVPRLNPPASQGWRRRQQRLHSGSQWAWGSAERARMLPFSLLPVGQLPPGSHHLLRSQCSMNPDTWHLNSMG